MCGCTDVAVQLNEGILFGNLKMAYGLAPGGSVGRAGTPYTEAVSSPRQTQVQFHLWPFAACHSPSLSPLLPVYSSAVLSKEIKAQKKSKKKNPKQNCKTQQKCQKSEDMNHLFLFPVFVRGKREGSPPKELQATAPVLVGSAFLFPPKLTAILKLIFFLPLFSLIAICSLHFDLSRYKQMKSSLK